MTIPTIEQVADAHARLGALIEQLKAGQPTATTLVLVLPETSIELAAGERYVGPVLNADGVLEHHLILLPGEAENVNWQAAKDWAVSVGGSLPTRQEQALLFANAKAQFSGTWYWSCQEHEDDGSYAWLQYFSDGPQSSTRKSWEGRARAVRRFTA